MSSVNRYNLAVVLFVALGSYTYGFNSSIIASVTGLPSFYAFFGLTKSGPNASWSTQMIGGKMKPFHLLDMIYQTMIG
ncbi:Major facilitator superfamily domain, general substrate transporter [Ilyonectria robusta]